MFYIRIFNSLFLIVFLFLSKYSFAAQNYRSVLHVLTYMNLLDADVLADFQTQNQSFVRVDFVGSRNEFESRLKSGLRNYDVIIADERILEKLKSLKLIKSLPENIMTPSELSQFPLHSKGYLDGLSYLPLALDPLGIIYQKSKTNEAALRHWNALVQPDLNPYWRQKIFVSKQLRYQLLIALIATNKQLSSVSPFISLSTVEWLKSLNRQNKEISYPLEQAFLGDEIEATVGFYSDFKRYKEIVSGLAFSIPEEGTYYDSLAVGWSGSSMQDELSLKLIKFLFDKKDVIAHRMDFVSLKDSAFLGSLTKTWLPYDDDIVLPKKTEADLLSIYENGESQ